MRRVSSFALCLVSLVTLGAAASAAEPTRSKLYIFGEQLVDGTTPAPSMTLYTGRKAAQFERMLRLRKDLTPGIFAATKEHAFK